jgi:hypothetical protein
MADEIDLANEHIEQETELRLKAVRGYEIPEGYPGECELCGEWSARLVRGVCAPCRDRRRLP